MIRLTFTGDVMMGRLVNDYLKYTHDYSSIWGNTRKVLRSSDLTFINLECALTKNTLRGEKASPVFFFKSDPEHVKVLLEAGVDYCSLANNHILDFGREGLLETLEVLEKRGICFAGAGKNLNGAQKPAVLETGDLKIKVFSFTDNEPSWEAGKNKPGIFFLPIDLSDTKVKKFIKRIKQSKAGGNFVIVSGHWGPNMVRVPPKSHRRFVRKLIDSGCDIFHGHSAHVFQAVEIYQGKVIFYDCGEMVDDYAIDPILRNDESFIFEVYLEKDRIQKAILRPTLIDSLRVNTVKGSVAERISSKMINLCKEFGTKAAVKKDTIEIEI